MDAAADYSAAVRALAHHLPAYVQYDVRSHVAMGPIVKDETSTIVVRTRDGTIVKGEPPLMRVGSASNYHGDVVTHPPFDPACYAPLAVRDSTFEGRPAEELSLANTCKKSADSDGDFTALFLDRASREPLAATGGNHDPTVDVRVSERFAHVGDYIMPSAFDVRVKGSGVMFWLDVTAHQTYEGFSFSDALP
jgi:hypothetical protein